MAEEIVKDATDKPKSGLKVYELVIGLAIAAVVMVLVTVKLFSPLAAVNNILDKPVDVEISSSGELISCTPSINKDTKESLVSCDWDNIKTEQENTETYRGLRTVAVDEHQCVMFAYYKRTYTADFSCRT